MDCDSNQDVAGELAVRPKMNTFHFRQFKLRGIWEQILDKLVVKERIGQQREETPSLLAIASQSVKIMQFIEEATGIDGNKKINGRKRSILVDRLGLPWSLVVSSRAIPLITKRVAKGWIF